MIESRFSDSSKEDVVNQGISYYFEKDYQKTEIAVIDVEFYEGQTGEKYISVAYAQKNTTSNEQIDSYSDTLNLHQKNDGEYVILYDGFTGDSEDILEIVGLKNSFFSINELTARDYVSKTGLDINLENISDFDFGAGKSDSYYNIVVETKSGDIFKNNIEGYIDIKRQKLTNLRAIFDIPYNEFADNLLYIYITNVNSLTAVGLPSIGEDSFSLLISSTSEDEELVGEKLRSLFND